MPIQRFLSVILIYTALFTQGHTSLYNNEGFRQLQNEVYKNSARLSAVERSHKGYQYRLDTLEEKAKKNSDRIYDLKSMIHETNSQIRSDINMLGWELKAERKERQKLSDKHTILVHKVGMLSRNLEGLINFTNEALREMRTRLENKATPRAARRRTTAPSER